MTPAERMRGRRFPLRLVIYDCDGVIVDSEAIANRITAKSLTGLGWEMTPEESQSLFLGMSVSDMIPVIEAHLGRTLPPSWRPQLLADLMDALGREATAIEGSLAALHATSALGLPWRVASNSSHEEMQAKFACLGITDLVARRVHSHRDVARAKPAPDLFLAAAAAEGVSPPECVVIEDSVPGARGAAAAGMDCLGYAPHSEGLELQAVGASVFHSMSDLPGLLALALQRSA